MDKKSRLEAIFQKFCSDYLKISGTKPEIVGKLQSYIHIPYEFEPYHKKIPERYTFALDFVRPLVDPRSKLLGKDTLRNIDEQLKRGENVILLANHQTEGDPQIISVLLEKEFSHIGSEIIYVAGERVVTDPLAIPFSMGCNLLCIYSKRYIDHPPEQKSQKQLHNKRTMELMSGLLKEGGKIIYVAPSGGRDRKNQSGKIEVAPLDPQALEMFYLMSLRAKTPTHFYPFALYTYELLPPPATVQKELGEERNIRKFPAQIEFLPEFNMEKFSGSEENDKIARRMNRASALWNIINAAHDRMIACSPSSSPS